MNDLGLNFDHAIKEEIIDGFQIQSKFEYVKGQTGLPTAFKMFISQMRGARYIQEKANEMNYKSIV